MKFSIDTYFGSMEKVLWEVDALLGMIPDLKVRERGSSGNEKLEEGSR